LDLAWSETRSAGGALDFFLIEDGGGLFIGMISGQYPDSLDDRFRIANLVGKTGWNGDRDVFRGTPLPSDMQNYLLGGGKFFYGDIFDEQSQNALAVFGPGGGSLPQPWQISSQGSEFGLLFFCHRVAFLALVQGKGFFDFFKLGQGFIPAPFQPS
jgi:hypothetical protein